jgi:hypothetical protein
VHHCYGGEDLRILGDLVDHSWSIESSGAGPGWGLFCMGCASIHQDDGTGDPFLVIRLL